jgi:hypothetical protein
MKTDFGADPVLCPMSDMYRVSGRVKTEREPDPLTSI